MKKPKHIILPVFTTYKNGIESIHLDGEIGKLLTKLLKSHLVTHEQLLIIRDIGIEVVQIPNPKERILNLLKLEQW